MNSRTLENLVRQSDLDTKLPLELWRQRHRSKRDYRPSAAALIRRATQDVSIQAAEAWR